jgi:hypothetical protein
MLSFKKLTICFVFISLILSLFLPLTNVLAEDIPTIDPTLPFIGTPVVGPLIMAFKAAQLMGFSPTQGFTVDPVPHIANGIIAAAGNLLSYFATLTITLGRGLLDSVLSSGYTWLSPTDFDPTSKTYNEVVATGWGIVRNVANAALVIGLVIIAINIILGREENKAKKTLINFIIIALLINFTPIICGFIIDGSNILMKSFAGGGIDSQMSNNISTGFSGVYEDDTKYAIQNLMSMALYLIFALVLFFIYVLYSLLFIGRAIILWLLVIVSPIAFATKVFPQSKYIKKVFPSILYWDDWWESFIQWCVIGIPAGMSIYLANMTIKNITFNIDTTDTVSVITSVTASSVEYLIPFIILLAGFFISISAGGQIGSAVEGIAKGAWARTGGRAIGKAREITAAGGEWAIEGGKRATAAGIIGGASGALQGYKDKGLSGIVSAEGALTAGLTGAAMGALSPIKREEANKTVQELKEKIKLTRRGTYASDLSGKVEEEAKFMGKLGKEERKEESYKNPETREGSLAKAGAWKSRIEKDELDKDDLEYLAKNKDFAKAYGINLKDVAKKRPDYASQLIDAIPGKTDTPVSMIKNIVQEMNDKKAGTIINSPSYLNTDVLLTVASVNPRIIDGKLSKGTGEDISNIKTGYVDLIKHYLPGVPIDDKELKKFARDKSNEAAIKTVISSLEKSTDKDDQVRAQGLKNLTAAAWHGKFNK